MESKKSKRRSKNKDIISTLRLSDATAKKLHQAWEIANKDRESECQVKNDAIISMALDQLNEDHYKKLQENTLKNSERKRGVYAKYIDVYGPTSQEEFIGFTMTPAYFDFLKEHSLFLSQ